MEHDVVLERLLTVEHDRQGLVVDLDQVRRIACELARSRDDGGDGITHVAHLPDSERVVLDVRARRGGELEEGIGEDRHFVTCQRPVDTVQLERLRDVDRSDARVGVR